MVVKGRMGLEACRESAMAWHSEARLNMRAASSSSVRVVASVGLRSASSSGRSSVCDGISLAIVSLISPTSGQVTFR